MTIPRSGTSRVPRVGLATYAGLPDLSDDDRLLVDALARLGMRGEPVVWNDSLVQWDQFDAVVLRSTWDYHLQLEAFLAWIAGLERAGVALWNPPAVLRWNARKTYLQELAERGVTVIATRIVRAGEETPLAACLAEQGWDDAVVKPLISASAHETWRTSPAQARRDEPRFRALVRGPGALIQPFAEAVPRAGEWSFCLIGGSFSHAVLKEAAAGEFRVQPHFGGRHHVVEVGPDLVQQAEAIADLAPAPCLYARVDGYIDAGRFHLMELEVLEPSLFLDATPQAAARFGAAIHQVLDPRAR